MAQQNNNNVPNSVWAYIARILRLLFLRTILSPLYLLTAVPYIFVVVVLADMSDRAGHIDTDKIFVALGLENGLSFTDTELIKIVTLVSLTSTIAFEIYYYFKGANKSAYKTEFELRFKTLVFGWLAFSIIMSMVSLDIGIFFGGILFLMVSLLLMGTEWLTYAVFQYVISSQSGNKTP